MLLVNQILHNRYRIMRMLGQGGMGAVYEAHDNVFDTTCAVKEIMIASKSGNNKQQEMLLRAFEREAKLLAKIKHESVPHVRDYFTQDNQQYLVMELVEGKDLGELLEERKIPFPLEDVMRWMEQLLDGLDYLHTQNPPIFHRDLKPQNLKLTPRGKIKLLDFGIAKGGAEVPNSTTINNQTFVAATLNYSPIEQIFRVLDPVFREVLTQRFEARIQAVMQQNADARSDLYALGATAYHLLTGFLPLDSLKRTIEVWSGKADPLDHPTKLNSHIPPEIANVLLKAMELDYNRRYASALEMQQALQQALADIKLREANQAQNTLEMSSQPGWQSDSDRLRQQQQATRLPTDQSFTDQATQQIPIDKLPLNYQKQQGISEETIQSGALGYNTPGFGQNTGGTPPPTPNSPFNTGGNQQNTGGQPYNTGVNQQNTGGQQFNTGGQPYNTGGQQYNTGGQPFNTNANQQYNTGGQSYQSGGNVQPTEMVNFAGATGGNMPQAKFPSNPVNTGGAMNSNNPISPGANFAPNYAAVQQPKTSNKAFWVVPLLLLMFLGVAGAGGGLYLWYQANEGTTENITPTPTVSPSVTASASKTPTPTPSASPSQSPVNSATPATPTPTAVPTTTRQVTVNTPAPRTPVQNKKPSTQKKPNQSSDCIFTGC
jgi:serine/threonine protein kinase